MPINNPDGTICVKTMKRIEANLLKMESKEKPVDTFPMVDTWLNYDDYSRLSRSEKLRKYFTSEQLLELVGTEDLTIHVSGLQMKIADLARAGWSCALTKNSFGGRVRVTFYGGGSSRQSRSVIQFRIPPAYRNWQPLNMLRLLHNNTAHEATINTIPILVAESEVAQATVVEQTISFTDEELLEKLQTSINGRLKGRKKKITPKVYEAARRMTA